MREFHVSPALRRRLAIVASVVVLLTLTGPFGTFVDLSGPLRLAYWTLAIGGCSIFMYFAMDAAVAGPWLADWPAAPRMALGGMIGAVPGAVLIALLEVFFRGSSAYFDHYFWFWFCISGAGFVVTFLQFAIFGEQPDADGGRVASNGGAAGARFLDRLPREIGRDIISLSMQDHYVQVTAARGSALVLIRFADAVQELADYPGNQIHRSHWVAGSKARRIFRCGNRMMIELVDGRSLPVSRPYLQDARKLVENAAALPEGVDLPKEGKPI